MGPVQVPRAYACRVVEEAMVMNQWEGEREAVPVLVPVGEGVGNHL